VKIALNYRLYDYGAPPTLDELAGNVQAVHVPGFQTEFGGRYVYGWTRFQKDLGNSANGLPVNNSRLTWDKMTTSSGELFGRIDTPENIMVKGFLGMGRGDQGHINDEDWGTEHPIPRLLRRSLRATRTQTSPPPRRSATSRSTSATTCCARPTTRSRLS